MKQLAKSLNDLFGTDTFTVAPVEMQAATPWRIEREPVKLFFRVVRTLEDGPEYVRSASGKVSIFKTYRGAQRAERFANAREQS